MFERSQESTALVGDPPAPLLTLDELLAEEIEIGSKLGEPLHTRNPLRTAGIEDREVLFHHLETAASIGLAGQDLQYRQLKTHARGSDATTNLRS